MTEDELHRLCASIRPLGAEWLDRAQRRLDSLTKPPGSLGRLEALARQYVAIKREVPPRVRGKAIVTFAADHGVTAEGVSAYPRDVTAQMVANFLKGGAAINVMARQAGARVIVVDLGVDAELGAREGLVVRKIARGTANLARGPAMTRAQAVEAVAVGFALGAEAARDGADLIGTGDMGIGNTTPSSAVAAALTGRPVPEVTGRGTGVDEPTWCRKVAAIEAGLAVNRPDRRDPLDVLAKVGGFEIGGIAGLILGGAVGGALVVVDGFISTAGAAIAVGLRPAVREHLVVSHRSAEAGHTALLEWIGIEPILDLDMRLGEGTGAALAMPIIETAVRLLSEMATFEEAGVSNREEERVIRE
jgi:nicotinate-nucleotide--dimethylbenzimidazole phosphoribosyltransferase